ncbi:MAG: hypothetical protein IJB16_05425 [Clostridia bacterium]|nr:hypothetical protein [Clostridia bacterium]
MKTAVIPLILCIVLIFLTGCFKKVNPGDTGMPDPHHILTQKTVAKVNISYGTDKSIITLRKPDNAYFEILPQIALDVRSTVSLKADDSSWRADICSAICPYDGTSTEAFAEYYFKGKLGDMEEQYDYFNQEITELESSYRGNPVMHIKTTYKKTGDENLYEVRFVGFEFSDKSEGKPNGKGLMGFKLYDPENSVSLAACRGLFSELFFIER